MTRHAGYSGTPLPKKLGIVAGAKLVVRNPPGVYGDLVAPLPPGVTIGSRVSSTTDLIHVFAVERSVLEKELLSLRGAIRPDAVVWISWPKKSARVPTDITEDMVRKVALPMGFVDVKVCAVNETWSGLKLVIRKELR